MVEARRTCARVLSHAHTLKSCMLGTPSNSPRTWLVCWCFRVCHGLCRSFAIRLARPLSLSPVNTSTRKEQLPNSIL